MAEQEFVLCSARKWRIAIVAKPMHRGRRAWRNRILILVFYRLRAQFYMYKNTLDILQVFPSG